MVLQIQSRLSCLCTNRLLLPTVSPCMCLIIMNLCCGSAAMECLGFLLINSKWDDGQMSTGMSAIASQQTASDESVTVLLSPCSMPSARALILAYAWMPASDLAPLKCLRSVQPRQPVLWHGGAAMPTDARSCCPWCNIIESTEWTSDKSFVMQKLPRRLLSLLQSVRTAIKKACAACPRCVT